jgi:hypothetical protein
MALLTRCFVSAAVVASFALALGACSEAGPEREAVDAESAELAAAPQSVNAAYNRKVEQMIAKVDPATGQTVVSVRYGLEIFDESKDTLDLSAKIVVSVNGRNKGTITLPPVVKESAITCAVTCAGACPSIFGDGVCQSCGCNYSNWFTSAFGGTDAPRPGDIITAKIVPTTNAVPEIQTGDDVGRFVVP